MNILASLVLYKHSYRDIEQTLHSLLSEENIDKLVIVDNGAFCQWLDDYTHPKVEVIKLSSNHGFGAGHNHVFEKFKDACNFFLICNPDIYYAKGEVDKFSSFCSERDIDLSVPRIVYPNGTLQYATKLLPAPVQLFGRRFLSSIISGINDEYELRDANYNAPFYAPSMSGCFMLVSSKAVKRVHGFDTRYFMYLEDVDFSRRISSEGLNVIYCPESTVIHQSQRKSYSSFRFLLYHLASTIKYFNKWGWFSDKERVLLNSRCLSLLPRKILKK
ncbi:glycosyltransferase family 2 protein [Pluralibacter gergoviae]|nr:glycosyltransferase family 2 protein [Pluralibacter gergoviae]EKV3546295.1 glycosyltransferase family 2 protein [Pluralibacter gergoviae]EKV9901931.1 glycosyltransferase family 2 protein [Pluralibacter gergoviae]EKV9911017.1 glycosyltransferase family 2 protein [Pluralibacter gergoviae]EKW7277424.1 glycosyltransferase family 2 protein [Pluralibacter gergoviae]EKW9974966.1 glycosyltransferase family 2 protein [Pluralibacter gergoviae]